MKKKCARMFRCVCVRVCVRERERERERESEKRIREIRFRILSCEDSVRSQIVLYPAPP